MPVIILIVLGTLLSACAKSGVQERHTSMSPSMTPSVQKVEVSPSIRSTMNMAVLSECDMLKTAFRLTRRRSGREVLSIVAGCPGYEDVPPVTDRAREARRFARATNAFPPVHVETAGQIPVQVFRRMIARGVPVSIARKVTFLPVFKRTVNAQSKQG